MMAEPQGQRNGNAAVEPSFPAPFVRWQWFDPRVIGLPAMQLSVASPVAGIAVLVFLRSTRVSRVLFRFPWDPWSHALAVAAASLLLTLWCSRRPGSFLTSLLPRLWALIFTVGCWIVFLLLQLGKFKPDSALAHSILAAESVSLVILAFRLANVHPMSWAMKWLAPLVLVISVLVGCFGVGFLRDGIVEFQKGQLSARISSYHTLASAIDAISAPRSGSELTTEADRALRKELLTNPQIWEDADVVGKTADVEAAFHRIVNSWLRLAERVKADLTNAQRPVWKEGEIDHKNELESVRAQSLLTDPYLWAAAARVNEGERLKSSYTDVLGALRKAMALAVASHCPRLPLSPKQGRASTLQLLAFEDDRSLLVRSPQVLQWDHNDDQLKEYNRLTDQHRKEIARLFAEFSRDEKEPGVAASLVGESASISELPVWDGPCRMPVNSGALAAIPLRTLKTQTGSDDLLNASNLQVFARMTPAKANAVGCYEAQKHFYKTDSREGSHDVLYCNAYTGGPEQHMRVQAWLMYHSSSTAEPYAAELAIHTTGGEDKDRSEDALLARICRPPDSRGVKKMPDNRAVGSLEPCFFLSEGGSRIKFTRLTPSSRNPAQLIVLMELNPSN